MRLSEHMYCVAITFKMTERVEQCICIRFCVKLEYFSMGTIWMIPKAAAMDNWWLAASSRQLAHSCITFCAEFWGDHQITQVTQPPYSPDLVLCHFWLFPKLKSPLKGKRFQTIDEIQENMTGQRLRELCEVPRCLPGRGLRCHCPMYNASCIVYLLQ